MNIEIANRLVKLRKQAGLSQEELADKLGLSRQAVSKWERAEASPDTDNLICLAKLYNISLDELLSTEDDAETIVNEQVKSEQEKKRDNVHIGPDGIFVESEDGETVSISKGGIHVCDGDGHHHYRHDPRDKRSEEQIKKDKILYWSFNGILYVLATVAYLLFGFLLKMWHNMWIVFFIPSIIMSLAVAIRKKRAHHFNIAFLSSFVFFLICLVLFPKQNLWHPMWAVFLAIPIYYILVNRIDSIIDMKCDTKPTYIDDDDEDDD